MDQKASRTYAQRKRKLKVLFNITPEQYQQMHTRQKGLCAICKQPELSTLRGVLISLCIDHSHSTNRVRELLCRRCNTLVGFSREDTELVDSLKTYLIKHSEVPIDD